MAKTSKFSYDREYYENLGRNMCVAGNTARKLDYAEPEIDETEDEESYEAYEAAYEARRAERLERSASEQSNRGVRTHRVIKINLLHMMMLVTAITALVYWSFKLLEVRSSITETEKQITIAEKNLNDVLALNESLSCRLDTDTDRNYIYSVAVGRLGMVYPDNNQIVYYETADSDYVRQYAAVP